MAKKRKRARSREEAVSKTVVTANTDFSGLDQINAIPDYTSKLANNFLENILLKYGLMTRDDLIDASKDKSLTVLESQIIAQLVDSINKGKGAAQARAMTQDRISGKATNKIEHSGPNGSAITISNSKLVGSMATMSRAELMKIKKAIELVKSVNDSNENKEE